MIALAKNQCNLVKRVKIIKDKSKGVEMKQEKKNITQGGSVK